MNWKLFWQGVGETFLSMLLVALWIVLAKNWPIPTIVITAILTIVGAGLVKGAGK